MSDEKIRVRIKLGANEVEIEGSASALGKAVNLIPELLKTLPVKEEAAPRSPIVGAESPQTVQPQSRGQTREERPATPLPEIRVAKDDSLTDVITKIFAESWGKQPRKLGQVREVLVSYGMIYPKQSVAVSLLRLAQSGRLRRFKGEEGEFVYVASPFLLGEGGTPRQPPLGAAMSVAGQGEPESGNLGP